MNINYLEQPSRENYFEINSPSKNYIGESKEILIYNKHVDRDDKRHNLRKLIVIWNGFVTFVKRDYKKIKLYFYTNLPITGLFIIAAGWAVGTLPVLNDLKDRGS